MELVKGIPITEYCDKARTSRRAERLELFLPWSAHAVQHAHQKGIIHRDLKPSNVMVTLHDGKPVPKVIDFGIAKATNQRLTEKTLFTEFRQLIGTPEYMSPEQAEMSGLDVDTRTDIYSLGVLLYELMTGSTPFDPKTLREAGYDEFQRIVREEEPEPLSTRISLAGEDIAKHRRAEPAVLRRLFRRDLDWIVLKALEKDRTRRYESATEMAADIRRHLVGRAVRGRSAERGLPALQVRAAQPPEGAHGRAGRHGALDRTPGGDGWAWSRRGARPTAPRRSPTSSRTCSSRAIPSRRC